MQFPLQSVKFPFAIKKLIPDSVQIFPLSSTPSKLINPQIEPVVVI